MKIIKGLVIFFIMICFGSCFDPPEFPVVPVLEFNKIEFVDSAPPQTDSLILYVDFKDGDGDLGLDNQDIIFISYPYNNLFFFQEKNGTVDTLFTYAASSQTNQYDILDIPNPEQGKLVFPRTRKKPGYTSLPAYNCVDYEYLTERKLLIEHADLAALDNKVRLVDTLRSSASGTVFYQIQDTLYSKVNPNHYNIEVDFLEKKPGDPAADSNGFVEFDWRQPPYCTQSYDGRFPVLSERQGSALEGTLKYSMNSIGFVELFSVKTLKLRVQIKDRALNRSRVIETPEFTLDKIRK